jgi:hypothetical protein
MSLMEVMPALWSQHPFSAIAILVGLLEKKNGSMDTSFSCDESILNFFFCAPVEYFILRKKKLALRWPIDELI